MTKITDEEKLKWESRINLPYPLNYLPDAQRISLYLLLESDRKKRGCG